MFAECGVYLPTSQIRFHYEFAKLSLDFTLSDVDQRPAIQAKIEAVRTKYAKMLVLCLIVKMGHTLEDLYIVGTIGSVCLRNSVVALTVGRRLRALVRLFLFVEEAVN